MSKRSHSFFFNLPSSIGSITRIHILFPEDYEVWAFHFEDYVLGIETRGSSIWHAIIEETYKHSKTKAEIKTQVNYNTHIVEEDVPNDENDKLMCKLKAMRIIWFAFPLDTFRLVNLYDTPKKIWDRLKGLYYGDDDLNHSLQTTLLSEWSSLKQNTYENLEQTVNRFIHLLSKFLKNNLKRQHIVQKVTFMNSLISEWKTIVSIVKAHEQFKNYSLEKLVGSLKSHEEEVMK